MSYAGVECDPGWVAWAEQETIARLRDQLSDRRARRELRRIQAESGEVALDVPAPEDSASSRLEGGVAQPTPSGSPTIEATQTPVADHPQYTQVTAFSEPPARDGAAWHDWAEAQTILRLQQPRKRRRKSAPQPKPVSDLRIAVNLDAAPPRTVRVHHENLKAVGI